MTTLNDILARVRARKQPGQRPPVVVFDLDGTLFDNGPRTWQILVDFAESHGMPELRAALDRSPRTRLPYLLRDTMHLLGEKDDDLIARALEFWKQRFFTDDSQRHDEPLAGAVRFAQSCWDVGATLVYLSGRDAPNMLVGVAASLRSHSFPVGLAHTALVLKPRFEDTDLDFKADAVAFIDTLGDVVATFDNEPANCNLFQQRWPAGSHYFVRTQHAPDPPPLHPAILHIDDLTH